MSDAPAKVDRRGRRTFVLLAVVGLAPVVAAWLAYFVLPREARVNYGALILPTAPAPALEGRASDGAGFRLSDLRGRWAIVIFGGGACDDACRRKLYATRQARTIQGREQDRVVRVLLATDGALPASDLLAQHPGLVVASVPSSAAAAMPGGAAPIYLVDPHGNLVMSWPDDPDIKRLAKDLERLLKASSIG